MNGLILWAEGCEWVGSACVAAVFVAFIWGMVRIYKSQGWGDE